MNPNNQISISSRRARIALRATALGALGVTLGLAMSCASSDNGTGTGTVATAETVPLNADYATGVAAESAALSDSWGPVAAPFALYGTPAPTPTPIPAPTPGA